MLTFLIRTKANCYWSRLSWCQVNFLQNVFNRGLWVSDFKATYTLKLQKLLSNLHNRSCTEGNRKFGWQCCFSTSWRIVAIYSWHMTYKLAQPLLGQRTLHSKAGACKRHWDAQVSYGAHQTTSVTSRNIHQKLTYFHFSVSDISHHSRKNIWTVRNHCGMEMASHTRKGLKLDTFQLSINTTVLNGDQQSNQQQEIKSPRESTLQYSVFPDLPITFWAPFRIPFPLDLPPPHCFPITVLTKLNHARNT